MKLKSYAAKTNQGPYLQINEDTYDIDLVNDLYMIFDGYGGSGIGDKCVSELKDNIRTFYTKISSDSDSTMPFYYSSKYLIEGNALINAIHFSHKNLFKSNKKIDISKRAGSSIIAAAQSENILTFIGSGNCLVYLYRHGDLTKIINEETISIFTHNNQSSFLNSTPLSGIGLFEDIHLTTREVRIKDDDLFIMMTDGVFPRISNSELKIIIEKTNQNIQAIIERCFDMANERGNLDNQSCVLLQY
ncbi:MAG: hypothetical protein HQK50_02300 [Oligoflexia bacterium]|nr:hypothetical protein [Oligoflexia bacterium]MBF0364371.1 hypothetical protein [Oligoflexia bacterium]